MKKTVKPPKTAVFFETVAQEARSHPVRALSITDEENAAALGLVIVDNTLEQPRIAHLLRKTALSLSGAIEPACAQPSPHAESGQVTVEERAQLFTLFSRGMEQP